MMSRAIFISHVFEDRQFIGNIKDWVKDPHFGYDDVVAETQQDIRPAGYDAIHNHLKVSISGCKAVIVLIGNDTHNHDWIRAEAELANTMKIPIACVRIPKSTGGMPPILANKPERRFRKRWVKAELLGIDIRHLPRNRKKQQITELLSNR